MQLIYCVITHSFSTSHSYTSSPLSFFFQTTIRKTNMPPFSSSVIPGDPSTLPFTSLPYLRYPLFLPEIHINHPTDIFLYSFSSLQFSHQNSPTCILQRNLVDNQLLALLVYPVHSPQCSQYMLLQCTLQVSQVPNPPDFPPACHLNNLQHNLVVIPPDLLDNQPRFPRAPPVNQAHIRATTDSLLVTPLRNPPLAHPNDTNLCSLHRSLRNACILSLL